eukprot:1169044-Pyramimonas_sp.AAC.1
MPQSLVIVLFVVPFARWRYEPGRADGLRLAACTRLSGTLVIFVVSPTRSRNTTSSAAGFGTSSKTGLVGARLRHATGWG